MIKLPKKLTTVTPFSKLLAMGLFLILPIVGFYIGMRYQETLDFVKKQDSPTQIIPRKPLSVVDETANWQTYRNEEYGLEMKYPNNLSVSFSVYSGIVLEDSDNLNNGKFFIKLVNQKFEEAIKKIPSKEVKETQINKKNAVYYSLGKHNQYYKIKVNTNQVLEVQIILTENGSLSFEEQSKIFDQILATFKFIDQSHAPYTCPSTRWISCMPQVIPSIMMRLRPFPTSYYCSNEYLQWAKINCPNFEGAAY